MAIVLSELLPNWIPIPGWLDLVDIAVVAAIGWVAIGAVRRTRARPALFGLATLAVVYLFARGLNLQLTAALFQGFFAVVVLVLVVVFQEDLRRVFEQIGSWRRDRERAPSDESEVLDLLVRSVARLASTRTGALIVLPRREPLERHVEGGVALGGRVSEPLLLSIFDSSSPGHDGAVVLRGSQVERFALHLPLSSNLEALGPGGTRHAAALGLAERTDAICIAVSEERGTVSVARDGAIHTLRQPEDLARELRSVFDRQPEDASRWHARRLRDPVIAVAGAITLWAVFVPGSDVTDKVVEAPIRITNLPDDLELESIDPETLSVTLRGLRRDLLLPESTDLTVEIDAYLARFGRRTFAVSADDVQTPDGVSVVAVEPERIRISLEPAAAGPGRPPSPESGR
jgi:uncharacterized protein (TIGR00159 family)